MVNGRLLKPDSENFNHHLVSSLRCALLSRVIAAFVQLPIAQVLFFKVVCLEVQARCNMHESGQLRYVAGDNEGLGLTCWKTKKTWQYMFKTFFFV